MNSLNRITLLRFCVTQILTLGALLLLATPNLAQTPSVDDVGLGCRPLDDNKRSIYISYDSVGSDISDSTKQMKPKVWLRLHNNLTCGIRIPTLTLIETNLTTGKTTTEFLQDGARITVVYYVQNYKQKKTPEAAPEFYGLEITHWPILPPGKSIVFSVPAEYFKKGLNVVVIFVYIWEGFNSQSLVHQVYFLNEMLPERALQSDVLRNNRE